MKNVLQRSSIKLAISHQRSATPNGVKPGAVLEVLASFGKRHHMSEQAQKEDVMLIVDAQVHKQPGMLGLHFTFLQPHQRTWPTDGTIDWLWPEAERAGIPVALAAANFLPVVG